MSSAIRHKITDDLVFVENRERFQSAGHYERTKVPTKKFAYKVRGRGGRLVNRVDIYRYDEARQMWVK